MRLQPTGILLTLGGAAIVTIIAALTIGSSTTGPGEVWAVLRGDATSTTREIILGLRLPRLMAAFATGASLSVAGALMQVLVRNPLADPYVLGTSGGAATFALTAMVFGASGALVDLSAFAGAMLSTLVVFVLARGQRWDSSRLLLTGIVTASAWGAAVSLILAASPERNLRGALFWLMGDFSYVQAGVAPLAIAAGGTVAAVLLARALNVLSTGDSQAAVLGLAVRRTRIAVYVLGAALTANAVTTAGTVGFVGLVVPHLVRIVGGADNRLVLPASALAGGSLLVLADVVARTMIAPRQLPVGAITAIVGVALFLFLLRHRHVAPGG
jgi:iron complex transport system permease protein